jgi:cell division protease FtsH
VIEEGHDLAVTVLKQHMDDLNRLSAILIERETIDKDQFERLLAGETEEQVFPEEASTLPEDTPPEEPKRRPQPRPRPLPFPGATMQPPPPEGAKS